YFPQLLAYYRFLFFGESHEWKVEAGIVKRAAGSGQLALAAVNEQQVGHFHAVHEPAREAAVHRLVEAVVVVWPVEAGDADAPVVAAAGAAALERDDAADRMRAHQVADVEPFDAPRRLLEPEQLLQFLHAR